MGTELHQTDTTAWRTFISDLRLALSALRKAPLLPLASLIIMSVPLAITSADPDTTWFPIIMVGILFFSIWLAGWPGTERVWYRRLFQGETMSFREALGISRRFIWPFISLALHVGVRAAIPYIAMIAWYASSNGAWQALTLAALIGLAVDIWLTFVTPALSFTTLDAREAIRIGQKFLREHWSHVKWFALVPPLAALITLRTASPNLELPVVWGLSIVGVLLNLLFKGATAAYYLRHQEAKTAASDTN